MTKLTFDQLPDALLNVQDSLADLKQLVLNKINPPKEDTRMGYAEVANMYGKSIATIKDWVYKRKIPYSKVEGEIVFYRSILEEFEKSKTIKPLI